MIKKEKGGSQNVFLNMYLNTFFFHTWQPGFIGPLTSVIKVDALENPYFGHVYFTFCLGCV